LKGCFVAHELLDDRSHPALETLVGKKPVPFARQGRANLLRRSPAARGIVTQHRPVLPEAFEGKKGKADEQGNGGFYSMGIGSAGETTR
jgi:hypothetical protein